MKYFLIPFFLLFTVALKAQKFALLDMHMAEPVTFTNVVTSADKFKELFPVEKKNIHEFINDLQQIEDKLTSKKPFGTLKNYQVGCIKFTGVIVPISTGERLDYVITATCDNLKITMHLCDAKIKNENNAFFIKIWIKYIQGYIK